MKLIVGLWEVDLSSCSRGNRIFLFGIFWNNTNLEYLTYFGLEGSGYWLCFYLSKRVSLCSRYGFFCYTFIYLAWFGVIKNRVTKVNSKYFNGNCDRFICLDWSILFLYAPVHKTLLFEKFIFELDASSHSFKITCVLLRQVITLKKIVLSSAKFTILISWSPICVPLILFLTLMKLASTSAIIRYNSMENRHPCQTPRIEVKGSDRGPFILILDWILVYPTSTM